MEFPPDFPGVWGPEWEDEEPNVSTPDVEIGDGPEVLGYILGPDGSVSHTLLSYRPVRFGYQKPSRCYEDQGEDDGTG